MQELAQIQNW